MDYREPWRRAKSKKKLKVCQLYWPQRALDLRWAEVFFVFPFLGLLVCCLFVFFLQPQNKTHFSLTSVLSFWEEEEEDQNSTAVDRVARLINLVLNNRTMCHVLLFVTIMPLDFYWIKLLQSQSRQSFYQEATIPEWIERSRTPFLSTFSPSFPF